MRLLAVIFYIFITLLFVMLMAKIPILFIILFVIAIRVAYNQNFKNDSKK